MFSQVSAASPLAGQYQKQSHQVISRLPERLTNPELFDALDGQAIENGHFTLNVYSVHRKGDDRFLQLALVGDTTDSLVVRIAPDATTESILSALEHWVVDADPTTRILHVC